MPKLLFCLSFALYLNFDGLLPKSLGANIKEFLLTILSEAERPQI